MNAITWALNSVRGRWVVQTMKVAASVVADLSFDWQHGTSTMRWVDAEDFGAVGHNLLYSEHYRATKARPFWKLLRRTFPGAAVLLIWERVKDGCC